MVKIKWLIGFLLVLNSFIHLTQILGQTQINQSQKIEREDNGLSVFTGMAGSYETSFQGKQTTSGEIYDENKLTASHRSLPLGTILKVTNLFNGRMVVVKVNDQGELIEGRVLNLSKKAANIIGLGDQEVGMVQAEVVKEPIITGKDFAKTQQVNKLKKDENIDLDSEGFPEKISKTSPKVVLKEQTLNKNPKIRGIYILQFGAFQNKQSAEILQKSLASEGINTYIATVIVGMKKLYKVRLDSWYRTQEEVVQVATHYLENGFECFIIGKLFISLDQE